MVRLIQTTTGTKFVRKLRKAADLSSAEWRELLIASAALLKARILFARLPAKHLIERLQRSTSPKKLNEDRSDPNLASEILKLQWAISAAAAVLPWRTDCLIRCLAADQILRRRGLTPDFYLGVTKHLHGSIGAHAWTCCHGISVVGGESRNFGVLIGPEES